MKMFMLLMFLPAMAIGATVTDDTGTFKVDGSTETGFYQRGKVMEFTRDYSHPQYPDFRLDLNLNRGWTQMRTLMIADIADPPDLLLQRSGPDNGAYDSTPTAVSPNSNIGTFYWRGVGDNGLGYPTTADGKKSHGRACQMYVRAIGDYTDTNRAGDFYLGCTPENAVDPIEYLSVKNDGGFYIINSATGALSKVTVGDPDSCGTGYRCLRMGN